jgi:hypothetical protein
MGVASHMHTTFLLLEEVIPHLRASGLQTNFQQFHHVLHLKANVRSLRSFVVMAYSASSTRKLVKRIKA